MRTLTALLVALTATASVAHAKLVTRPVAWEQGGTKLEGFLAYDDAKTARGKLPGVLVFPEWWGLTAFPKAKAEELAKQGYVALAVDMYGKGQTTDDAKKAGEWASQFYGKPLMAERAKAGLAELLKSGLVDDKKVAAIGFCFGGAVAQTLGYSGAAIAGVVSFHGSPVNAPESVAGKLKAKYLLLNGAADPFVKADAKQAWIASLNAAKIDFESIDFGEAVHAFTNPDADKMAAKNPQIKGAIAFNETAARRAWREMGDFFEEIFEGKK